MQLWQYCLFDTAKLLYMFRTLSASIIRSINNCRSSHWYMPCVGMMCSGNRPRTTLLDIHHPDPWHTPVAASTVVNTPDDGRRKRPKHVE